MINDIAKNKGITNSSKWEWCTQTNSTYLDCPIVNYDKTASFMVAIHNPSMKTRTISSIKTRTTKYTV